MIVTLLALTVSTPKPEPALTGDVRSPAGPAAGALVLARPVEGSMTHLVVADERGRFRFDRLPASRYRIEAMTTDGRQHGTAEVAGNDRTASIALAAVAAPARRPSSAAWLALLPESEATRRFILDCTGCHQFDETRALVDGADRPKARWVDDITRMLSYAGPATRFPVISSWPDPATTPDWLVANLGGKRPGPAPAVTPLPGAMVTEYDLPEPGDLPHDVAVEADGRVVITGMMSHTMMRLDPATGAVATLAPPVPNANPRAVELDRSGNWWVLFGGPRKVGRYEPGTGRWSVFDIGVYPHSVAVGPDGRVWFNDHFGQAPERIGSIDPASGAVSFLDLPAHPTMGTGLGGPVPYEQRIGPDGRIWVSELQGNRLIAVDPKSGRSSVFTMPLSWSGPRRFDVGADGMVWIPAYSANQLVRLDPGTGKFTSFPLPVAGATPYIVRIDRQGLVWVATSASDQLFRFDPKTTSFAAISLPSQGALVRHMTIDSTRNEVWLAYGASPGRIPARVARVRLTN